MFRQWLDKKFSDTQHGEADQFLMSLKGADNGVIDLVSASQMYWAAFYRNKDTDLYRMEEWIGQRLLFATEIGGMIKGLQKQGTTASVPGLMVWLHSCRALLYPELRLIGRQIWEELTKASSEAEALAEDMCAATSTPTITFDRHLVPAGLERLAR